MLPDASGGVETGEGGGDPDSDVATSGAPVSDVGNRVDVEETVFRSDVLNVRRLKRNCSYFSRYLLQVPMLRSE